MSVLIDKFENPESFKIDLTYSLSINASPPVAGPKSLSVLPVCFRAVRRKRSVNYHSLGGAQQVKVRKAPSLRPPCIFENAWIGSPKNITPILDIAPSKVFGLNS